MKQARDRATEGISFTAAHSAELYPLIYTAQGLLDCSANRNMLFSID